MVHNAILVNPDKNLVIYATSNVFVESNAMNFTYEATNEALALAKREDIIGGYIFLSSAPTLDSAKAIISAGIKKVIYKTPVENEDEAAACQLLEQFCIPAIYNSEIIITEAHAPQI